MSKLGKRRERKRWRHPKRRRGRPARSAATALPRGLPRHPQRVGVEAVRVCRDAKQRGGEVRLAVKMLEKEER